MHMDFMVDIETTGLDPYRNHIIQIAAVPFNLHDKTIGQSVFDQCLEPKMYARAWDEGTRDWWTGDKWDLYQSFVPRMRDPKDVMQDFQTWVLEQSISGTKIRVWGKPQMFDVPFIESYFRQTEIKNPFHYRYARDLNTYIMAKGHEDVDAFWKDIPSVGDAHNALHDCFYQIRGLFNA